MTLEGKIADSQTLIREQLQRGLRAVVMWSSGKDSMVLLHLLRRSGVHLPVIQHRQPNAKEKYRFADAIIQSWNLDVHDYPPRAVGMQHCNNMSETVAYYQLGAAPHSHIAIPLNLYEAEQPECGFDVLQQTQTGPYDYPYQMIFHGHKSADYDALMGHVPLASAVVEIPDVPVTVFPLREWTDGDIWEYSRRYHVPQQPDRYQADGSENRHHPNNPDYFNRCVRCLNPAVPQVICPKTQAVIASRHAEVNQFPVPQPSYITIP